MNKCASGYAYECISSMWCECASGAGRLLPGENELKRNFSVTLFCTSLSFLWLLVVGAIVLSLLSV